MINSASFGELRRILWHLRRGGFGALREKNRRREAEKGVYRGSADGARAFWIRRGRQRRLSFNEYQLPQKRLRFPELTVAVILDDFSLLAFGREWSQVALSRADWMKQIDLEKPQLLFVESAWAGNNGEWKYQLTGPRGPSTSIIEMVKYCRTRKIPTVFWNKEDPPHYADFLETARLFDYVYTSDSDRVPSYKEDLGHERIAVLQFAAQPDLHNPIRPRSGWHERNIAFAGMYFAHKYPERRSQMNTLLGAAREFGSGSARSLEIFSRHSTKNPNYQFPPPFNEHVVGSLDYMRMLTAYKAYRIFLNVNSVVDSPSMCARRIFEITASGTTVLSTPSKALNKMWKPDEQFIAFDESEASNILGALERNPELSARQLHRAQRRIWSEHTYTHRVSTVINTVLPAHAEQLVPQSVPSVSLIVSSVRPHQLEHVFESVGRFRDVETELVLSTHGFAADADDVRRWKEMYKIESLVLLEQPTSRSLGECLNLCVKASSGAILSKMDDDDIYGPHYLNDLVHSLSYSRADIVGKQAHYMYVASHDATLIRFPEREHKFTDLVMGPTITGRRDVFISHPFAALSRGEDTDFLRAVTNSGGTIYSADKYNYVQFRGSVNHAWAISDSELLKSGNVVFFGEPNEHVNL